MKKVNLIIEILEYLYPNPKIFINYENPFTFVITAILSTRSSDIMTQKISNNLFKIANTPQKIISTDIEKIKYLIRGLGLYNKKSKNIKELSKILIEKYNGKIPNNFNELERLPGIGRKVSSLIMHYIFKLDTFPVDTHIHRLMKKWGLSNGKNTIQTEKDAKKIFPKKLWNKLHLQIILYGKEYSPSHRWTLKKDFLYKEIYKLYN